MTSVEAGTADRATIVKINFSPKGHSKQTSNFPFISCMKILWGANKQDVLLMATLPYTVNSNIGYTQY